MMKKTKLISLLVFFALGQGFCAASTGPGAGTSGAAILASQNGVRPNGMGNAFVAVADDIDSMFSNPAGLGALNNAEFSTTYRQLYEGISYGHLAVALPLGALSSSNVSRFGTVGVSFGILDYGSLAGTDANGNSTGNFSAADSLWTITYGKTFFDRLSLGMSAKIYNLRIDDQQASGTAYDFGTRYKLSPMWTLGASVFNRGNDVTFNQTNESLPRYVSAGIAAHPLLNDTLTLAFDVVDPENDTSTYRSGVEWRVNRTFTLRGGYDSAYDVGDGFTVGFGVNIQEFELFFVPLQQVRIDYAFVPSGDVSTGVHNVSLTLRWGETQPK